jgi:hypothetical protein
MSTLARMLNSMLNGAIMVTVCANAISSIVGVTIAIGGLGGAVTDAQ